MTKTEVLRELESMGTAQLQRTYRRHGAGELLFGVSYASLGILKRKIRIDHRLARELWASGNHDARVLANMIADPDAMSAADLDAWIARVDNHMLSESMSALAARSARALAHADRWIDSPREWICATGWAVFAAVASAGEVELAPDYLRRRLLQIETTLQSSANRVRHSMVLALIGIGMQAPAFEEAAVAAACTIGPVHVNHGDTGCTTPDPIPYLRRAVEHQRAQREKAKIAALAARQAPKRAARAARSGKGRAVGAKAGPKSASAKAKTKASPTAATSNSKTAARSSSAKLAPETKTLSKPSAGKPANGPRTKPGAAPKAAPKDAPSSASKAATKVAQSPKATAAPKVTQSPKAKASTKAERSPKSKASIEMAAPKRAVDKSGTAKKKPSKVPAKSSTPPTAKTSKKSAVRAVGARPSSAPKADTTGKTADAGRPSVKKSTGRGSRSAKKTSAGGGRRA